MLISLHFSHEPQKRKPYKQRSTSEQYNYQPLIVKSIERRIKNPMFSVTVFTNSSRYTVNNNNFIIGLGDLLVNTRQDV